MIEYASMERESIISKHKNSSYEAIVMPFLRDAIQEGAHKIKPESLSEDRWSRQRNIGGIYIGSPAIYKDLTKLAGLYRVPPELRTVTTELREVTTEQIRQIFKSFLINLWNNCSPELQEQYTLNDILTARKPWSQKSRERSSASQGGASLKIKAQVESGITDIDNISTNTEISKQVVRKLARGTLKDWGISIPIPRKEYASYKKTLEQLEEETDDKKIQELLDQLPYHAVLADMGKKKEASLFRSLLTLSREAGFHPKNNETHFFETSLRTAGVPITRKDRVVDRTKQHVGAYYILLSRHKDRAMQVLKEDQYLQRFLRNPVKIICGATNGMKNENLLTTTKLIKKQSYEVVGKVLKELGIITGGTRSRIRYSDIFTPECSVPIYCYRQHYYYPVDQEEKLKLFIVNKLKG